MRLKRWITEIATTARRTLADNLSDALIWVIKIETISGLAGRAG
jgi:hypothetical protein